MDQETDLSSVEISVTQPDQVLKVVIPNSGHIGFTLIEETSGFQKNAVTQVRPRSRPRFRYQSLDSSMSRNLTRKHPEKRRFGSETRYSRDYEVRFTMPFKAYIDRIRNSCLPVPFECPTINERFERHRDKYHSESNSTQGYERAIINERFERHRHNCRARPSVNTPCIDERLERHRKYYHPVPNVSSLCPVISERLRRHRDQYHSEPINTGPQISVRTIAIGPSFTEVTSNRTSPSKSISFKCPSYPKPVIIPSEKSRNKTFLPKASPCTDPFGLNNNRYSKINRSLTSPPVCEKISKYVKSYRENDGSHKFSQGTNPVYNVEGSSSNNNNRRAHPVNSKNAKSRSASDDNTQRNKRNSNLDRNSEKAYSTKRQSFSNGVKLEENNSTDKRNSSINNTRLSQVPDPGNNIEANSYEVKSEALNLDKPNTSANNTAANLPSCCPPGYDPRSNPAINFEANDYGNKEPINFNNEPNYGTSKTAEQHQNPNLEENNINDNRRPSTNSTGYNEAPHELNNFDANCCENQCETVNFNNSLNSGMNNSGYNFGGNDCRIKSNNKLNSNVNMSGYNEPPDQCNNFRESCCEMKSSAINFNNNNNSCMNNTGYSQISNLGNHCRSSYGPSQMNMNNNRFASRNNNTSEYNLRNPYNEIINAISNIGANGISDSCGNNNELFKLINALVRRLPSAANVSKTNDMRFCSDNVNNSHGFNGMCCNNNMNNNNESNRKMECNDLRRSYSNKINSEMNFQNNCNGAGIRSCMNNRDEFVANDRSLRKIFSNDVASQTRCSSCFKKEFDGGFNENNRYSNGNNDTGCCNAVSCDRNANDDNYNKSICSKGIRSNPCLNKLSNNNVTNFDSRGLMNNEINCIDGNTESCHLNDGNRVDFHDGLRNVDDENYDEGDTMKCCMKTAMTLPSEICHDDKNYDCPIKVCCSSYRNQSRARMLSEHWGEVQDALKKDAAYRRSFSKRRSLDKFKRNSSACPQCHYSNMSIRNDCKTRSVITPRTKREYKPTNNINFSSRSNANPCSNTKQYHSSPNVYETYLHEEVNNWLKKVPFYPSNNPSTKQDRQNIINEMVDRLKSLVENVDDDNYVELVKAEINKCIDNLNIWYPGASRDQTSWRERICNSLLSSIREINKLLIRDKKCGDIQEYLKQFCKEKFTSVEKKVEAVGCRNCIDVICARDICNTCESGFSKKPCKSCKFELENEIQLWMNQSNIIQPFDVISKKDLKKLIADKVTPYLFKTYNPTNKLQIKSQIVETLQGLPICINCMDNHKANTMKYANDLTDRLLVLQTNLQQKDKNCDFSICLETSEREREDFLEYNVDYSRPKVYCDEVPKVKKKEFAVGNNLTDFLVEEIKLCLEDTALEADRLIEKSTLNIILKNADEIKDGNDNRAKVELFYLYQNTEKLTITENLNLVKYIMRTIKDVLDLRIPKSPDKIQHPIFVFTCYQVISLNNKTPLSPFTILSISESKSQISEDEEDYTNNVSAMIKEWLVSVDNGIWYLGDKSKTILANELAKSILEHSMLEHITPNFTTADKLKIWKVFIYKWLNKHKLYHDLNEANVKVSVLVSRLKDVSEARDHDKSKKLLTKNYFNIMGSDIFGPNILNKRLTDNVPYIKDINTARVKNELHSFLKQEIENSDNIIETTSKYLNYPLDKPKELQIGGSGIQVIGFGLKSKSDSALPEKRSKKNLRPQADPNEEAKGVILKYLDHSDRIDDQVSGNAALLILVKKLQRLSKKITTDLFERENFNFSIQVLEQELRYIAVISDWLKSIEVLCDFNEVGNKDRISFINSLASKIYKVEASRPYIPNDSNHYNVLVNVIIDSLSVLPLPPEDIPNIPQRADELATLILNLNNVPFRNYRQTQGSNSPEQNIRDFLEDYLRFNKNDLYNDHLKLDSVSKRILDELKLIEGTQTPVPNELDKYFSINPAKDMENELHYSKEISEWMKNLPVSEDSLGTRTNMISDLAERIYLRDAKKGTKEANKELDNYIDRWISSLPLQGNIDVPVVTQQLKRRINPPKQKKRSKSSPSSESSEKWYNKIILCRKRNRSLTKQDQIVDVIEDECNNLRMKGDNTTVKPLKLDLANNLFQTISKLNSDPVVYNNNDLYQNTLSEEIDQQLNNIPEQNLKQAEKKKFKNNVLNGIMAAKTASNDVNAGHVYEQRLEKTIETSMPNPVQVPVGDDPGFEIYKHRLAEMFIADNFDHSNQAVKLKYQTQIQREIDKYFAEAQKRNAIPLTRDQLQNQLYSTLFRVPVPNEDAISDEVVEVKTRSEVDQWLNELSLKEPSGMSELLEWDQILTALTRKVCKIEKNNPPDMDGKLYDEILKWLLKLPLIPGAKVNVLVSRLMDRLQATKNERKFVKATEQSIPKRTSSKSSTDKRKRWSLPPHIDTTTTGDYKSIDLLIDTVENWTNQIPLSANTQADIDNNNILRDLITTNIIMKVSELNSKPEIFDDAQVYENLVATEIDNALINLPQTDVLVQSKRARVQDLTESIMNLRPHVVEDREKHQYKDELLSVLINTLKQTQPKNKKDRALIDKINENIIENFLEYKHGYRDDTSKVYHKNKIQESVIEYLRATDFKQKSKNPPDPLIKTNEVITELSKVHPTNPVTIVEDIQRNRMRNEVRAFTRPLVAQETDFVKDVQNELSEALYEKEKNGHSPECEQAMKEDIENAMRSLGKPNDCNEVEIFIKRLRENEAARKMVLPRILGNSTTNRDLAPTRKPMSPTTSVFSVMSLPGSGGISSGEETAAPCCEPKQPCCENNEQGVQVNQPETATQDMSTEWQSMEQGTRVENLPGLQNMSSNQSNETYLPDYSNFAGARPMASTPNQQAPARCCSQQFDTSANENSLPDHSNFAGARPMASTPNQQAPARCCSQQFDTSAISQPVLPPCCNQEQVNQSDTINQNNQSEWFSMQQGSRIGHLPGFQNMSQAAGFQNQIPHGLTFQGFPESPPRASFSPTPQQFDNRAEWQSLPVGQNCSLCCNEPGMAGPQTNQNPASFTQGSHMNSAGVNSSSLQYIPPTPPPRIILGDTTRQSRQFSQSGPFGGQAGTSRVSQSQYPPQLPNGMCVIQPRCCYDKIQAPTCQTLPPQGSQWFTMEEGTGTLTHPQRSPTQMYGTPAHMQRPPLQMQDPSITQDPSLSYSGFAGGGQVASSPIRQFQNHSPGCCNDQAQAFQTPRNADGSQWLTLSQGPPIQMQGNSMYPPPNVQPSQRYSLQQGTPMHMQGYSGYTPPNAQPSQWHTLEQGTPTQLPGNYFQSQMQSCCRDRSQSTGGEVIPWNTQSSMGSVQQPSQQAIAMIHSPAEPQNQYTPAYPRFSGGSVGYPPQYPAQTQNIRTTRGTGESQSAMPCCQQPEPSQGLTQNSQANFQNASLPSHRNVSFSNNNDPNQTRVSYSDFIGGVPAASSLNNLGPDTYPQHPNIRTTRGTGESQSPMPCCPQPRPSQGLTMDQNTQANFPNFQNASASLPSHRNVTFSNNNEPNQTRVSYSDFIGGVPAASSLNFGQDSSQTGIASGSNTCCVPANPYNQVQDTQWQSLEENTPNPQRPKCCRDISKTYTVQMLPPNAEQWETLEDGTFVRTQGHTQMQGTSTQMQSYPVQVQGSFTQMQKPQGAKCTLATCGFLSQTQEPSIQMQSTPMQTHIQKPQDAKVEIERSPAQTQGPSVQIQSAPMQTQMQKPQEAKVEIQGFPAQTQGPSVQIQSTPMQTQIQKPQDTKVEIQRSPAQAQGPSVQIQSAPMQTQMQNPQGAKVEIQRFPTQTQEPSVKFQSAPMQTQGPSPQTQFGNPSQAIPHCCRGKSTCDTEPYQQRPENSKYTCCRFKTGQSKPKNMPVAKDTCCRLKTGYDTGYDDPENVTSGSANTPTNTPVIYMSQSQSFQTPNFEVTANSIQHQQYRNQRGLDKGQDFDDEDLPRIRSAMRQTSRVSFAEPGPGVPISGPSESNTERLFLERAQQIYQKYDISVGDSGCKLRNNGVCETCPFTDPSTSCQNSDNLTGLDISKYENEVCMCRRMRKMPLLQYCDSIDDFIPMMPYYYPGPYPYIV